MRYNTHNTLYNTSIRQLTLSIIRPNPEYTIAYIYANLLNSYEILIKRWTVTKQFNYLNHFYKSLFF